jgi:hypothetical protein
MSHPAGGNSVRTTRHNDDGRPTVIQIPCHLFPNTERVKLFAGNYDAGDYRVNSAPQDRSSEPPHIGSLS